ncbi:MAG: hypothetical protein WBX30_32980 [Stellaceae bacterium]
MAAILLRCLEIAKTFLVAVVVVRIAQETLGHRGFDESIGQLGAFAQSGDGIVTLTRAGCCPSTLPFLMEAR